MQLEMQRVLKSMPKIVGKAGTVSGALWDETPNKISKALFPLPITAGPHGEMLILILCW